MSALAGLRVVDLCTETAGSVAGMLLADLGAEVVRPESSAGHHRRPDPRADAGPVCWDRGKQHLVLPTWDDAHELLKRADVVLVDGGPGAVATAGFAPAVLEQRHPQLVVAWFPAMGSRGELADLPADPLLISAVSGYAQQQSSVEPVPIAPVVPIVSYVQGAMGASAIVAALLERRRSGRGQTVTTSGLHAVSALEAAVMLEAPDQPTMYRAGRNSRSMPAFRLYRCGDGKSMFLGCLVGTLFVSALAAIDRLELMVMPGVDGVFTNLMQTAAGMAVAEALEEHFAQQPRQHWLDLFAAADVPAAPVWTRDEWLASEAAQAVGGLVAREHPDLGTVLVPASGISLSETPASIGELRQTVELDALLARWPAVTLAAGTGGGGGGALAGLKVIDMATFIAGPLGPSMMGQWGADVIKLEPVDGDPYRVYSLAFIAVNQGKRSVVANLRTPQGRQLLHDLVAQADVLVENLRGEALARMGLTEEKLREINPRLVHCSVTAFGPHGPLAGTPGFDPLLQARSGLMYTVGAPGDPVSTGTPVHDVGGASLTTLGALAALWARDAMGVGQRIDVSLASSTLLLQCGEYTEFDGRPPAAHGGVDFLGPTAARRYYQASDEWIAVAAQTDSQFEALLQVLGVDGPCSLRDPADGALAEAMAKAIAGRTVAEWVAEFASAGVPAAPVVPHQHALDDEHLVLNEFSHVVMSNLFGRTRVMKRFADWSRSTVGEAVAAASKGEHGPEVLAEIGWDSEAISEALVQGTVLT